MAHRSLKGINSGLPRVALLFIPSSMYHLPMLSFFYVHGSVHLGNVYVQLNVQLDVLFGCILYSSLFLALHVSGAICTHPKEHGHVLKA
jgi:hypothetical protein